MFMRNITLFLFWWALFFSISTSSADNEINLDIDENGRINDFLLRMDDQKRHAVKAFKALGFRTLSAGDSYNDISMLKESDRGVLFCPPQNVIDEYPEFEVSTNYNELETAFAL